MGMIQTLTCPSCHESWEITTGHGILHSTLERVLKAFPQDTQMEIRQEVQGQLAPIFYFNYRMASCGRCKNIVAVPVIEFPESGRSYTSFCPQCGTSAELVILKEDASPTCPRCGTEALSVEDSGRWD